MKNNNEVSSVIKSAKKVAIGAGVVSGVAAFSVLSGGQVLAEELPADRANLEMVVTEEAQQEVNNVSNEELAAANEVIANSVEDTNVEAETSDLADTQTEVSANDEDYSCSEEPEYEEDTSYAEDAAACLFVVCLAPPVINTIFALFLIHFSIPFRDPYPIRRDHPCP